MVLMYPRSIQCAVVRVLYGDGASTPKLKALYEHRHAVHLLHTEVYEQYALSSKVNTKPSRDIRVLVRTGHNPSKATPKPAKNSPLQVTKYTAIYPHIHEARARLERRHKIYFVHTQFFPSPVVIHATVPTPEPTPPPLLNNAPATATHDGRYSAVPYSDTTNKAASIHPSNPSALSRSSRSRSRNAIHGDRRHHQPPYQ